MIKKEELSEEALNMIASRFKILSDPTRLKLLYTLGDKEMNVSDLVSATQAGQANVSKHLGVMLDAGLVARRKEGLNSIYRVSDETIFELCEVVCARLKTQFESRQNALAGSF
ncbi:MAG: transcriptional regulator, ArsR family [Acidobacteria bacterium]|nr:transcriptional regulator, ArsR family [Acidobacteriota bacterium]